MVPEGGAGVRERRSIYQNRDREEEGLQKIHAFSFGQGRFEYPVNIHREVSGKQLIVESKAQERKNRFSSYLHRIKKVET